MDAHERLKEGMRWMWSLGDYARLALLLEPHAEALAEACDIRPGMPVLDVGAGNGNFALAAARRGAAVTASDFSPHMVQLGRARSSAAQRQITWVEGDAEQLPFDDASFEIVASVFGAMFAPRPERVAAELLRVLRPGGLVAMANYGPVGFLARLVEVVSNAVPPASTDVTSPFLWGDAGEALRRLGQAASIEVRDRTLTFEFESFAEWLDFWEQTNPPQIALKTMLPGEAYRRVVQEIERMIRDVNQSRDGGLLLESEYLQVLARRGPADDPGVA